MLYLGHMEAVANWLGIKLELYLGHMEVVADGLKMELELVIVVRRRGKASWLRYGMRKANIVDT